MKIIQASHVIILYQGCYSYLVVYFYMSSIYESVWTTTYRYLSNCAGFVFLVKMISDCSCFLSFVSRFLTLSKGGWKMREFFIVFRRKLFICPRPIWVIIILLNGYKALQNLVLGISNVNSHIHIILPSKTNRTPSATRDIFR